MDKGNSGSRYRGFRPHSLRMQTFNRHTISFNRSTTPRINEYLPALPVELNLCGGNLESAVYSMYKLVDSAVGNTIGNNHPVINGALKLSASVIMMAGLAGMISGCAAGGNINNSQDENTHEHRHEHGSENGLEYRGQHTGINGVSSLDECLLDEYLGGGSQSSADSKVVSSKNNIIPETVNHKKELSTYLHKHFDLENADEILKSLPEDNYLETLELIKYAHDNLGLKSVDEYDLKSFSKLAEHNGLDLLKYAHENLNLGWVDTLQLENLVELAKNKGLMNTLKTKGKELFDYTQKNFGSHGITVYGLKCLLKLAKNDELSNILKTKGKELFDYAHTNLNLNTLHGYYLETFAKLTKNNGLELLKYAHENFGLKSVNQDQLKSLVKLAENDDLMDVLRKEGKRLFNYAHKNLQLDNLCVNNLEDFVKLVRNQGFELFKYAHENFGFKKVNSSNLKEFAKLAKNNGFDLLKYAHKKFGLTEIGDFILYKLSNVVKDNSIVKLKGLQQLYDINKINSFSDLAKLLEHVDNFDEKKAYLFKRHGITHFERYSPKIIKQLYDQSTNFRKDKKNVILYVVNKNDRDDAFKSLSKQIRTLQKNYLVIVYEVNNDREAVSSVKKTSKLIGRSFGKKDFIVFSGHGSKVTLNFGYSSKADLMEERDQIDSQYEHLYFDVTDEKELNGLGKYTDKGSTIILNSCSTGHGGEGADNLANAMASCLPGRTIYASKSRTKNVKLQVDDSGKIKSISFPHAETYKVTK